MSTYVISSYRPFGQRCAQCRCWVWRGRLYRSSRGLACPRCCRRLADELRRTNASADTARDAAGAYVEEWARDLALRPEGTTGPSRVLRSKDSA